MTGCCRAAAAEIGQLGVGDRANRLTLVRVGAEEAFGQSGVLMVG